MSSINEGGGSGGGAALGAAGEEGKALKADDPNVTAVFNVKSYGAKGDETTDDSTAIQAAINAAVNATFSGIGATVFFPNGKYYIATGLTVPATALGLELIGQGNPGYSGGPTGVATGATQILVGNGIWGLTLEAPGGYRGWVMKNLNFYEKTKGGPLGGLHVKGVSGSIFTDCTFGEFRNTASTTFNGTPGTLTSLGTKLKVASTTGWPTSGAGYIECVPSGSGATLGQIYHWFTYTGISGSELTGVTFAGPAADTVVASTPIVALIGVGTLVDGAGATECSDNHWNGCRWGKCTTGFAQIGVASSRMNDPYFDGNNNIVSAVTSGSTGLWVFSGGLRTNAGNVQSYDVGIHIAKSGQGNSINNLRMEGHGSAGIILEADAGTTPTQISGACASNISACGPGVIIKPGVTNAVNGMLVTPTTNMPVTISDQGTNTRYPSRSGLAKGAAVAGNVVGQFPQYDGSGTLLGYAPLYDSVTGIYLKQNLGGTVKNESGVTTVARTLSAPVSVGDMVVVGGGYGGGVTQTVTITDSRENTWTTQRHDDMTTGATPHSFIASTVVTTELQAGDTITATFGGNVNAPMIFVYDYGGQIAGTVLDVVGGATGTSTEPSTGEITTTSDYPLLFSSIYFDLAGTPFTPGSGFTVLDTQGSTAKRLSNASKNGPVAGKFVGASGTLNSSVGWAMSVVAFKKVAVAAPTLDSRVVAGPASATDARVAVFDGTTGKLIKDGGKTVGELGGGSGITAVEAATLLGGAPPTGITYQSYDRLLASGVAATIGLAGTGKMKLTAIMLPKGISVANISYVSGSTALTPGTSPHFWVALYDQNLKLLRQSTDNTGLTWEANKLKTTALSSSFETTYAGLHFCAIMLVQGGGGTAPTLQGISGGTTVVMGLAPVVNGNDETHTGLTATAPAEAAALTVGAGIPYCGVA